jgi:hypothetical protein
MSSPDRLKCAPSDQPFCNEFVDDALGQLSGRVTGQGHVDAENLSRQAA